MWNFHLTKCLKDSELVIVIIFSVGNRIVNDNDDGIYMYLILLKNLRKEISYHFGADNDVV